MDDMQRYRDIKANADPDDPAKQLLASIAVSYDQAIAEAIQLERSGKRGALDRTLRRMGLTETADLLMSADGHARDNGTHLDAESGCPRLAAVLDGRESGPHVASTCGWCAESRNRRITP